MPSKYLIAVIVFFISTIFAVHTAYANDFVPMECTDSTLLWLVNKENKLYANYEPADLVEYGGVRLRSAAQKAFVQMIAAMESDGIYGLRLQSAYRTYAYQEAIFNQRIGEFVARGHSKLEAEYNASLSIQPPGASEHQLGLALDVSIGNNKLTQAFGETEAGKWLNSHCHEHGFIIRYPSSKTDVTQIVYEPWHLRYVGTPHAAIMKNLEFTLEEYLRYIREVQMYVFWGENNAYYLLSYSPSPPFNFSCAEVSVSSLDIHKRAYIITSLKTYPNI